ncbi:hypothetical protein QBC34DRAFT_387774 [Podospora aff. communis PSN243]|uniref:Ubiquitin-like protease family profile domain-containing protein n=1 Tax=Podospora aff. communis PSN243 TaxID=3040156 RepID=A0AAV9G018_9PEZI|nr:hypothetical protein QBC34DRAFT_387774 [Podospora aff. communis PSN243]
MASRYAFAVVAEAIDAQAAKRKQPPAAERSKYMGIPRGPDHCPKDIELAVLALGADSGEPAQITLRRRRKRKMASPAPAKRSRHLSPENDETDTDACSDTSGVDDAAEERRSLSSFGSRGRSAESDSFVDMDDGVFLPAASPGPGPGAGGSFPNNEQPETPNTPSRAATPFSPSPLAVAVRHAAGNPSKSNTDYEFNKDIEVARHAPTSRPWAPDEDSFFQLQVPSFKLAASAAPSQLEPASAQKSVSASASASESASKSASELVLALEPGGESASASASVSASESTLAGPGAKQPAQQPFSPPFPANNAVSGTSQELVPNKCMPPEVNAANQVDGAGHANVLSAHLRYSAGDHRSIAEQLRPGSWLSDLVIDAFLGFLALSSPSVTYISPLPATAHHVAGQRSRITDAGAELSMVLLPMLIGNNHWVLASANPRTGCISVYDPGRQAASNKAAIVARIKHLFVQLDLVPWSRFSLRHCICPQQTNNDDCGVFCLAMASFLVAGQSFPDSIDAGIWRAAVEMVLLPNSEESCTTRFDRFDVLPPVPQLQWPTPPAAAVTLDAVAAYERTLRDLQTRAVSAHATWAASCHVTQSALQDVSIIFSWLQTEVRKQDSAMQQAAATSARISATLQKARGVLGAMEAWDLRLGTAEQAIRDDIVKLEADLDGLQNRLGRRGPGQISVEILREADQRLGGVLGAIARVRDKQSTVISRETAKWGIDFPIGL